MNRQLPIKLTLFLCLMGGWFGAVPSPANVFNQQEVNQEDFIAIARPYGNGKYDLLILQQIPGKRQCWNVNGSEPGIVQPLLLDFDFTGSCERATDSNGYSLRVDGQDLGLNYLLRIVERNGELVLIGTPRDPRQPEMIVGRTRGRGEGLLQIYLVEGWRFTKRAFEGRTLSHVYLTGDSAAIVPPADLVASKERSPRFPIANEPKPSNQTVTEAKPANPNVREYTFTAPDSGNNSQSRPSIENRPPIRDLPPATARDPLPLPPPPTSSLPPLTPPTPNQPSRIVPPPAPRNAGNRGTLSDVIGFNRQPPASNPPTTASSVTPTGNRFKVMIDARTEGDRSKVRSLYPDAFRASYKGRSFLQIGVFTSRDKAESALQSLAPLSGSIVPF
ncbi:DUF3747 domain-containing protein [Pannus brasiliensis CCIBt3594]|uniref:DUF3747 domain-containing protein n=1 Tax=Pannus brasiliensis CCIBt3594 TaxID=1427578 RepID=A0AAW9QS84_9CHRO